MLLEKVNSGRYRDQRIFTLNTHLSPLKGLLEHRLMGPTPGVSDSAGVGRGPRMCVCNNVPGGAALCEELGTRSVFHWQVRFSFPKRDSKEKLDFAHKSVSSSPPQFFTTFRGGSSTSVLLPVAEKLKGHCLLSL